MKNMPVYVTRDALVDVLNDILIHVREGDSMEGHIEWQIPEEGDPPDGFRVKAAYRVGNLQGQGGMRIIGQLR